MKPSVAKRLIGLKEQLFLLAKENMKCLASFDLKKLSSVLAQVSLDLRWAGNPPWRSQPTPEGVTWGTSHH